MSTLLSKADRAAAVQKVLDSKFLFAVLQLPNPVTANQIAFLSTFSDEEISLLSLAGEYMWFYLNNEAQLAVDYYDIANGVINWDNLDRLYEKTRQSLTNKIPEILSSMERNERNKIDMSKIKFKMTKLLSTIASHDSIIDTIGSEIKSLLHSAERAMNIRQAEELKQMNELGDNQLELTLQGPKRSLLVSPELSAVTPGHKSFIDYNNFSFSNHPELRLLAIAAIPLTISAVCAFTLVCSRAASLGRMGSCFARAINSGITFLKGGDKASVTLKQDDRQALEHIVVVSRLG